MSYLRNLYQLNQLHFRQIKIEMERKMNENNESMIENEPMKETTSSEDSDADMAECSNGYDEPLIDQGIFLINFTLMKSKASKLVQHMTKFQSFALSFYM